MNGKLSRSQLYLSLKSYGLGTGCFFLTAFLLYGSEISLSEIIRFSVLAALLFASLGTLLLESTLRFYRQWVRKNPRPHGWEFAGVAAIGLNLPILLLLLSFGTHWYQEAILFSSFATSAGTYYGRYWARICSVLG